MKIALNGATTMRADLETDIHVAQATGFDFLEIWAAKLRNFLQHRTSSELNELLAKSGVPPLSINSIEHVTFRSEERRVGKECRSRSAPHQDTKNKVYINCV